MTEIGEHMERVIVIRMSSVWDGKELARKIEDELTMLGMIKEIIISHPSYNTKYVPKDDGEAKGIGIYFDKKSAGWKCNFCDTFVMMSGKGKKLFYECKKCGETGEGEL